MVVDRGAGPWVLAVARPEDPEVLRDLLVGHAGVVRHATLAGDAKLLEDLAWMGECEAMRPAERVCDVLDNAPVLARITRTVHGLVDLDDAPLDLRYCPFVFLLEAAW